MASSGSDNLTKKLTRFLEANPSSSVAELADGKGYYIERPWGDSSLRLVIPPDRSGRKKLIESLNTLTLPPRLSALYHVDQRALEFIYSARPVSDDLVTREFEFKHANGAYHCGFAPSSEELLTLAKAWSPMGTGRTGHRNLQSFWLYTQMGSKALGYEGADRVAPYSFWVRPISWDEDQVLDVCRHLNFYMRYFDRLSPQIELHEPEEEPSGPNLPFRYREVGFPSAISSRAIDPIVLGLSESAWTADPFRRFIYAYQVLEYAAFYYMQEQTAQRLRLILGRPNAPTRVEEAAREIFDVVTEAKLDDDSKLQAVVKLVVDPAILWDEITHRSDVYCRPTEFDGGFVVPPLIKDGWTAEDWAQGWMPGFAYQARNIRNALSHAREARMSKSIAPTARNARTLAPWSNLLAIAANEVAAFENI